MKKRYFVFVALVVGFLLFSQAMALAGPQPMRAIQLRLNLEFWVYRTPDMPANWFRTFDGHYVTRVIGGDWIYGVLTQYGIMRTNMLVGTASHGTMNTMQPWPMQPMQPWPMQPMQPCPMQPWPMHW